MIDRVRNVLSELNETSREIIEMRHTDGMTFPEIGAALEMKMETAKKRYYRALAKFKDVWGEDESDSKIENSHS